MALTVEQGFTDFAASLTPSQTETALAASHRATIEDTLSSKLGMTHFFRSGSFGHNTSVRGYSDIDFFAVFPASKLTNDSSQYLQIVRLSLLERLPRTDVSVRSPAVIVPFGRYASENHEIVPAWHIDNAFGHRVFGIPDRAGSWMESAPEAYNAWVNMVNTRLGGKLKPLIRLVKAWALMNGVQLRSFWVEMRVTEWAALQENILFTYSVFLAMCHLSNNLAAMADPFGIGSPIDPCTPEVFEEARRRLSRGTFTAAEAVDHNDGGRVAYAFQKWTNFFNGQFETYG